MAWALAAALAAGILQRLDILAGAFAILLVFAWARRPHRANAAVLVALTFLLFGYGIRHTSVYNARCAAVDSVSTQLRAPFEAEGFVCSFPVWSPGGVRFEFDTRIDGIPQRLLVKANAFTLSYGDSLRATLKLNAPGRMRGTSYLRGRGVTGSARVVRGGVAHLPGRAGNPVARSLLWPAHDYLRRTISRGSGSRAGVPMALLLGERGYLDRRVSKSFSTLGISHLLALSGFHLGFVAGALVGLLRLCRVRSAAAVLACLVLYVGVVGVILSLYRALAMVLLLVVAARVRRPLRPVTALVEAFLLMLLVFPSAIYSLGFQLSFMATFAVLICVERMRPVGGKSRVRKVVSATLSTLWISGFVQMWVAPILLGSFGGLSVVAPVATVLFVVPVVAILALTAIAGGGGVGPMGHWQWYFCASGWSNCRLREPASRRRRVLSLAYGNAGAGARFVLHRVVCGIATARKAVDNSEWCFGRGRLVCDTLVASVTL